MSMSPLVQDPTIHRAPRLATMRPPPPILPLARRAPPGAMRPASPPAPSPRRDEAAALAAARCETPASTFSEPFPLVRRKQRIALVPEAAGAPDDALAEPREPASIWMDPTGRDAPWRRPSHMFTAMLVALIALQTVPECVRVVRELLSGAPSEASASQAPAE